MLVFIYIFIYELLYACYLYTRSHVCYVFSFVCFFFPFLLSSLFSVHLIVQKDMGLWHIALVVPQFIAVPIAGGILDSVAKSSGPGVGYAIVFAIAAVYFLVGAGLVGRIKAAK